MADEQKLMTYEQFMALQNQMKEAQKDDTPYLAVDNEEELHVIGDPNKTEVKSADYTVYFIFPDNKLFRGRAKAEGYIETDEIDGEKIQTAVPEGYFLCKAEMGGVHISPRNIGNAMNALVLVEQFFYDVTEDGDVKNLSYDEARSVFNAMTHEISDATYEVVSAVLRIPAIEQEWMLPLNVMGNAVKIVANNPEVANASDLFFGLSSSSR